MVDLAVHILDSKASKLAEKFEDKSETALKKLIKRKAAGKTIEMPEREEPAAEPTNLIDALRQSLGRRPTARRGHGTSRRASRTSARTPYAPGRARVRRECTGWKRQRCDVHVCFDNDQKSTSQKDALRLKAADLTSGCLALRRQSHSRSVLRGRRWAMPECLS